MSNTIEKSNKQNEINLFDAIQRITKQWAHEAAPNRGDRECRQSRRERLFKQRVANYSDDDDANLTKQGGL